MAQVGCPEPSQASYHVGCRVSLAIAVEIEGPQVDPTGHRGFEDAGRNRLALPLHRPGQPHIDGNDPHRPWPPYHLGFSADGTHAIVEYPYDVMVRESRRPPLP